MTARTECPVIPSPSPLPPCSMATAAQLRERLLADSFSSAAPDALPPPAMVASHGDVPSKGATIAVGGIGSLNSPPSAVSGAGRVAMGGATAAGTVEWGRGGGAVGGVAGRSRGAGSWASELDGSVRV